MRMLIILKIIGLELGKRSLPGRIAIAGGNHSVCFEHAAAKRRSFSYAVQGGVMAFIVMFKFCYCRILGITGPVNSTEED